MPDTAGSLTHPAIEAAASSGSNILSEVGAAESVASNSTQTRFSFYNASEIASASQEESTLQAYFNRQQSYQPITVATTTTTTTPRDTHSGIANASHNNGMLLSTTPGNTKYSKRQTSTSERASFSGLTPSASSSTVSTQRFAFYERQSSADCAMSAPAATSLSSPPGSKVTGANFVDNWGNHNLSNGKHVTNLEDCTDDDASQLDSVQILRSLQQHEQQRLEILGGPKHPIDAESQVSSIAAGVPNLVVKTKSLNTPTHQNYFDQKSQSALPSQQQATAVPNTRLNTPVAFHLSNPYEEAIKEALDLLRKHRTALTPRPDPPVCSSPSLSVAPSVTGEGGTAVPFSPSGYQRPSRHNHPIYVEDDSEVDDHGLKFKNIRTPPEEDRVLQQRGVGLSSINHLTSPTNSSFSSNLNTSLNTSKGNNNNNTSDILGEAYQAEIEARRKRRQERMAKYASRLAELKQESDNNNVNNDDGNISMSACRNGRTNSTSRKEVRSRENANSLNVSVGTESSQINGFTVAETFETPISQYDHHNFAPIPSVPTSEIDSIQQTTTTVSQVELSRLKAKDDEVQRGVERVLLAILDRANGSRGRAAASGGFLGQGSEELSKQQRHYSINSSWQLGEEKKSSSSDEVQELGSDDTNALLRAMSDLLAASSSTSLSPSAAFGPPYNMVSLANRQLPSDCNSTEACSGASPRFMSPLDAIEHDDDDDDSDVSDADHNLGEKNCRKPDRYDPVAASRKCSLDILSQSSSSSCSSPRGNFRLENRGSVSAPKAHLIYSSSSTIANLADSLGGIEAVASDPGPSLPCHRGAIHRPQKKNYNRGSNGYTREDNFDPVSDELDELIRQFSDQSSPDAATNATTTSKASSKKRITQQVRKILQNRLSSDRDEEENDESDDEGSSLLSGDNFTDGTGTGTGTDDDEPSMSDDGTSYATEDDDPRNGVDRVLGPLSKKSGGTTGVVLEPDSPNSECPGSLLESLSAAMSLVTGQSPLKERSFKLSQPVSQQYLQPTLQLDNHSRSACANSDHHSTSDTHDRLSLDTRESLDSEANELMRTLFSHVLPKEMHRSYRQLEPQPSWDESNPEEPGYRIVRITNHQLRRVEHEFESVYKALNLDNRQQRKIRRRSGTDSTFERDLQEAEDLLNCEEKRYSRSSSVTTILVNVDQTTSEPKPSIYLESGSETSILSDRDESSLDHFHGIKRVGRGEMGELEYFHLPIIFKSHVTGFEPTKDMCLEPGNIVAGQYLVEGELGSAAFSTAYRCIDLSSDGNGPDGHEEVCLKVIKNTKDFFDQSLDEIKILEFLRQTGKCHEKYIIEMRTFFYHREHLIIVTELLRQNLFEFGKFILDHDEEPYFTLPRLAYITRQVLIALEFVHGLGLVHSDVKPENILLESYSRALVKVIDFGSSCYITDRLSSYIQSRSYRAPEVILGLPYNGRIDIWSLGCVVAEMYTGEVTFQNDSVVSMLSRIEAICGPFPRHMIAQGRQSGRFFTESGLIYEKVPLGDEGEDEAESQRIGSVANEPLRQFDIFQPKATTLATRLGFEPSLMDVYDNGSPLSKDQKRQALFVDFVRGLLSIDPAERPTAAEALKHPWIVYAGTLTEEDIKYPSC